MTSVKFALSLMVFCLSMGLFRPLSVDAGIFTPQEQGIANALLNDPGQKRNKGTMQADATLTAVARARAKDMATRRFFGHVNPNGIGPNYAVRSAGYPLPLWWGDSRAENNVESISAGYPTATAAWSALLASPAHRKHLLAADSFYQDQTNYGVGYYYDESSPYWSYFVVITAPPKAKTTLNISSPVSGSKIGASVVTVAGTVGGSGLVGWLDIRLENASGTSGWARVSLPAGTGVGAWSTVISGFVPGANTVRLRSYTGVGNLLKEATSSVRWVVLKPLTVAVDGDGDVTDGFLGTKNRELGVNYTIAAKPNDNRTIFSHWTGLPQNANAESARQTFTMTEGLSLVAHFVPNPYGTLSGVYQGVLGGLNASTTGQLRVSVTPLGKFSGRLYYGAGSHAISGTMNASGRADLQIKRAGQVSARSVTDGYGRADLQIKRAGQAEIGLSFSLDITGATQQVIGTVNEFGVITPLRAERRAESSEALDEGRLVNHSGQFTVRITPDTAVENAPHGSGYAIIRIAKSNNVTVSGTLADGRAISASSIVSTNDTIPIYARLFSGAGAVTGTTTLVNTTTADISGSVRWFKPERLSDQYYPQAFTTQNAIIGSRYLRPVKGTAFIDFQTAQNRARLLLSSGNIQTQITQSLEVGSNNTVDLQTPTYTGMKVTVNASTGLVCGSFLHPTAGVRKFSGVVSQKQRVGWGFFLGVDQGGSMLLQP